METLTDKKAIDFVKKLYGMNQILKNIYKNEPNFSPTYILTNNKAYFYDIDCIPELLKYHFNEKLSEDKFQVTLNSKEFFSVFKESTNLKGIFKVDINKENIIIYYKDENEIPRKFMISKDSDYNKAMILHIKQYEEEVKKEDVKSEITVNEEIIKTLNEQKTLTHLIADLEENIVYIKDLINTKDLQPHKCIEFFLCKKFLNGLSYKIKSLKKGDIVEYTPINIKVNSIKFTNNNFNLTVTLKLKNEDKIEHQFMICEF